MYVKTSSRRRLPVSAYPLTAAYKLNSSRNFLPQPPVYALLTDLHDFYFISYNGSKFSCTPEITVSTYSRLTFLEGMMKGVAVILLSVHSYIKSCPSGSVTERLFSMLLHAFIRTMEAVEARSEVRGEKDDVCLTGPLFNLQYLLCVRSLATARQQRGLRSWTSQTLKYVFLLLCIALNIFSEAETFS